MKKMRRQLRRSQFQRTKKLQRKSKRMGKLSIECREIYNNFDNSSETTDEVKAKPVEEPKMKAAEPAEKPSENDNRNGTTDEAKAPCDTTEPTAIDEPLSNAVAPQQPQNNKNGKANNKKGKKNAKVKIDSAASDDAGEAEA